MAAEEPPMPECRLFGSLKSAERTNTSRGILLQRAYTNYDRTQEGPQPDTRTFGKTGSNVVVWHRRVRTTKDDTTTT
jgi:hypothetical protein